MFQKILVYVVDRAESRKAAGLALATARLCDARVFAVWVLPPEPGPSALEPAKPRRAGRKRREPEEFAWRRLYEIEEDAFEANVRTSLLLEYGDRDEKLLGLIDSYRLETLIIGARTLAGWERLIERCPVAVILAR